MESIHNIWKKTDFALVAAHAELTPQDIEEAYQDEEALSFLNSFNLNYFFGHVVERHDALLSSHKDVIKEYQLAGMEVTPSQIPAREITKWIQDKSRYVALFGRVFRKRYTFDLTPTRDRLRRSALKIHENLALMENLLSKENFEWAHVSAESRNASLEPSETLTNILK